MLQFTLRVTALHATSKCTQRSGIGDRGRTRLRRHLVSVVGLTVCWPGQGCNGSSIPPACHDPSTGAMKCSEHEADDTHELAPSRRAVKQLTSSQMSVTNAATETAQKTTQDCPPTGQTADECIAYLVCKPNGAPERRRTLSGQRLVHTMVAATTRMRDDCFTGTHTSEHFARILITVSFQLKMLILHIQE